MRTLTTLALLLCTSTMLLSQVPSYVPAQGLLAWYSFSGSPSDLSGNGNHLTNSGATLSPDRYGNPSSAYSFNGSSSYLIDNTPGFIMSDVAPFTVSLWMKKTTTTAGVMLMHGSGTAGNFVYLLQAGSSSSLQFGTNRQQSAWIWAQATYAINTWTHLVGVYQNYVMTFYVNGSPVATNTFTYTSTTSATLPFYVGRGVSGNYVNATLDDIGVWNRALTPAEVTALYMACQTVTGGISNITECDSYASPGGTTYTASGTFQDTLKTFNGCDSIITLNLTINHSTQSFDTLVQCFRYVSPSGLYTWTSSGIYKDTLQNATGCDSVITINLTINTVDTSVTHTSVTLTANAANASYRWLNCNQSYSFIPGAVLKTFSPLVNGNYAVEVTQNGCIDTSSCYIINSIGMSEMSPVLQPIIFPNPSSGSFSLMNMPEAGVQFSVFDVSGKRVYKRIWQPEESKSDALDLSKLDAGIYFVEIRTGDKVFNTRIIIQK